MKDASGGILYVGKAKNLKRRVQSYFQNNKNHTPKTEKLVKHLTDFDVILTDTEFEAFMLECQLIHEIKPYYNRKMKSPESYSYIEIKPDGAELRRITTTSTPSMNENSLYFGPYTSKSTVEKVIQALKESYQINCTNPSKSKSKSACLNYSLGLCIGICLGGPALEQYNHIIDKIADLLSGKDEWILEDLTSKMEACANGFEFEKAAKLRDTIEMIQFLRHREKVIDFIGENQTILVLEQLQESSCKLFLIKRNKILLNEKIRLDNQVTKTVSTWIKSVMNSYIKSHHSNQTKKLNRDEIDEAQIIYSYLTSSNCSYEMIPDEVFADENQHKLVELIQQLITKQA
ncbi:UvrB/UvrC motif-containing protein [Bacillus marasmi]|uniref:UvrB/UvrC motif-containing protein n=1 Tax=Bacillus marasmi TaxID=1926279 RepID=UPI001C9C1303|nr:UvrB/UvrC motif-containing protein [Bacillus marasmi]